MFQVISKPYVGNRVSLRNRSVSEPPDAVVNLRKFYLIWFHRSFKDIHLAIQATTPVIRTVLNVSICIASSFKLGTI